jgi:hypothetical protein
MDQHLSQVYHCALWLATIGRCSVRIAPLKLCPQVDVCDYNPLDHTRQFHEFVGRLAVLNETSERPPPHAPAGLAAPVARTRFSQRKTALVRIGDMKAAKKTASGSTTRKTPLL